MSAAAAELRGRTIRASRPAIQENAPSLLCSIELKPLRSSRSRDASPGTTRGNGEATARTIEKSSAPIPTSETSAGAAVRGAAAMSTVCATASAASRSSTS